MPKTYRLAILADRNAKNPAVTSYTTITCASFSDIQKFADRLGALICGWKVAA